MGYTSWSDDFYRDRAAERARTGSTVFTHNKAISDGKVARKVHAKMDPKGITRESRDSEEHPMSVPIGVFLDVTGSMRETPVTMQKALPKLMATLKEAGVAHPQILFGAIGDFTCDKAPCQVGQFESGLEMEDDLGRMFMEGGGGGSYEESYQNVLYFFARHTVTDAAEKRGQKGWLFMIGDEHPYATIRRNEAKELFGDDIQADIPVEDLVKEVKEKYNVYFLIPVGTCHGRDPALRRYWEKLLGAKNVGMIDDPSDLCNIIARVMTRNGDSKAIPVKTSANARL